MFNRSTNRNRGFSTVAALAAGLAITVASATALAATGPVSQVEYMGVGNYSIPLLLVQINGVNYIGQTTTPGCGIPTQSTDTIKIWLSMAQSAMLAGKTVTLYTSSCNNAQYITDLVFSGG